MARPFFTALLLALSSSCTVSQSIDNLAAECPPPEYGRPGYVRTCAGVGAWIGGIIGGVASVVLWPVTWPLSQLAGDGLGETAQGELIWLPAVGGAATGHFLLGAPIDGLDYVFRRAWTEPTQPESAFLPVTDKPAK
jgi:hypothetical protein